MHHVSTGNAPSRQKAFARSRDAGALGLVVPDEHGGVGGGLAALAEACEAVGAACASTGMVFLMHEVTAATIAIGGGPAAAELLPRMAAGAALGTLAFSERGTGAHFYTPGAEGDARERRRSRSPVARASSPRAVTPTSTSCSCRARRRERPTRIWSPATMPACRFDGAWDGLGMAGNSSIALELARRAGRRRRPESAPRGRRPSSCSASSRRSSSSASRRSTSGSRLRPRGPQPSMRPVAGTRTAPRSPRFSTCST